MTQFPLSQAQKLWLTHGQTALQTQTLVLQLSHCDTPTALTTAWQTLVEHHHILSMRFVSLAGVTLPVMQTSESPIALNSLKCENHSLSEAQAMLPALSLATPLSIHYVTHNAGHSVVLRALPCLLDAVSMQLVVTALQQIMAGEPCAAIDEESITQFPDFCAWLQDLQEDDDAVESQQFWRAQQISDATGSLFEQKGNSDTQAQDSPNIKQVTRSVSATTLGLLQDWALTHSVFDPEEAEAGAIEQALVFLARIQQQRISTGQPVLYWLHDCRLDYDELRTCFGPMARPLPLTHTLELQQSATASWQAWQQHTLDVLEAQENVPDTTQHASLVVQFLPELIIAGERDIIQWDPALLNAPLSLHIQQDQGALQLIWHFDATRFSNTAVQAIADGYLSLISELTRADNTTDIAALALTQTSSPRAIFAPSSSNTLTEELQRDIPTLLSQIQHHAVHSPDNIALQNGTEQLSYAQLWQQVSNVKAAICRSTSADLANNPVAIHVERGLSAIVAMLATWAADSFYVILDTDWPASRLNAVIAQANPAVILRSSHAVQHEPAPQENTVTLDIHTAITTEAEAIQTVTPLAQTSALAYVLFTSGSTGTPKGVQVTQRNLAHYVSAASQQLDLAQYRQFLHCATFSADMGHTVLFPALMQGSTVHIPAMATLTNANDLGAYIHAQHIDVIKYVPSHLQALLSSTDSSAHSVLPQHCLVLGGEPCSGQLLQHIQTAAPELRVFNHYGPTETTVGVMIHAVTDSANPNAKSLPLTQALGDNRIYVLNNGQNAAFGELGEVVVQGSSVSAGYRGEVSQSANEAFIHIDGHPAYRTGDLARLTSTGELHLAGRADQQVKIRGYRVELGDIEACLASAEGVSHAAVKRQPQGDSQWLIAYASGNALDEAQLTTWLAQHLPEMMLPQRIVLLDTMPLLASGKIDRQQLPSIDALASQDLGTCEPPANDVEFIIHDVFKNVLAMDEVGVNWDFFAIGGHSLSAIKITGQLRKQLQIELPPGLLFEHSSIRKLAVAAQSRESEPGKLAAVAKIRRQLANMTPEQLAALKAKQAQQ